ncbi:MAG TPA: hypothetical protein VD788_05225 [Candidatus Polarisedimenticolaceae bacterium]|nr:hypothetical protein [Candidatus Polarisedimenticolaceae bacterium]
MITALRVATIALGLAVAILPARAQTSDASKIRELEARLVELERTLETLRAESDVPTERIEELERAIAVLSHEVEDLKLGDAATVTSDRGSFGLGPAASKVYRSERGVSVGGYGEMLYESFDDARQDGQPSDAIDQLDFLRAVLYFGYKFNDRILFNSEIEWEHATTSNGGNGEVSVEFAYLDFTFHDLINARAGMVLVPMGFLNELHEPPIFLGARRPYVEQALLPTTWRENGAGVFGENDRISYRAYVHTALAGVEGNSSGSSGFDQGGVRNGRSKGSRSPADELAISGRFDWFAAPGLVVGLSAYRGDAGQGASVNTDGSGGTVDAVTTIVDAHVDYRWRGLQARGVWVDTTIDDVARLNAAQAARGVLEPGESIGESQYGWYAEVGYDLLAASSGTEQALIPYLRYERYDTQDEVPEAFDRDPSFDRTVVTAGVAWKPITQVVVKADYNRLENEADTGVDQINAALGFMF